MISISERAVSIYTSLYIFVVLLIEASATTNKKHTGTSKEIASYNRMIDLFKITTR